uniref:Serpentine receptor class gamma n=1 Tax=Strongyloides venezuelensis TaxID=75913 RepID=A0A0K0F421_STRVS
MENNDWTATTFYVIAAQQTLFMFLITLLISINRYIAVKYPLSYEHHFSKSKIIIILLCFIILSTMIGLGNIFLNPRYKKSGLYDYFIPYLESKNVIYYQIFCHFFIYGTISIATCIFNVMTVLTLKKHNKTNNKSKGNLNYIKYSIFIFITLFIVETFFICEFIALNNEIKFLSYIAIFLYFVGFDLTSVGDFYFLIYLSSELRKALKIAFGCSKKFSEKVNTKVIYRINYYIAVIIVCRLLYQNYALENSAKNNNFKSVSLEENESLRNFIKRDTIITPIAEVKETKYLEKRKVNKKIKNLVKKKSNKKKSIKKKPSKKEPSKQTTKKSSEKTTKNKPKTTKKSSETTTGKPITTITTTKSTTTTTKPGKFPHLISGVINKINDLRQKHHAKKLIVSETLVKLTREMSDQITTRWNGTYTKHFGMLEFIDYLVNRKNPFDIWIRGAEKINYDKLNETTVPKNFGQLVWVSTTNIGCHYVVYEHNNVICFICLFYPKGNIPGKYQKNVLKP